MATFGNGAATGTAATAGARRPTRKGLRAAPAACCAAVAGTTARGTAECRIGSVATPTVSTTTSDSAFVYQNNIVFRLYYT